jgi:hypothetical protein
VNSSTRPSAERWKNNALNLPRGHVDEQYAVDGKQRGVFEQLSPRGSVRDCARPRTPFDFRQVEPPSMPDEQVATHEVALGTVVYLHFDARRRLPFDDAVAGALQQLDGTTLRAASNASAARHTATYTPARHSETEHESGRDGE